MQKERIVPECYPLEMDHLPEFFCKKAKKELNETPETREIELKKLKDLLSADKLMCVIEFEEDFLHQFLRHRKYDSLRAFQYIQKYISFRRNHPSMFLSVPEKDFKGNHCTRWISILPYRCRDGCAVALVQFKKCNDREYTYEYFKRQFISSFLQALRYPMTQVNGFKFIYDFEDTLKHMKYFTPQNLLLGYNAALNCVPARYKEIHLINKSLVLAAAWALMKPFFSDKLKKRFIFHSNPEELLDYFPKSIIPIEYGGSLEHYHDEELKKRINVDHGDCPEGGQPNII